MQLGPPPPVRPSGRQLEIAWGEQRAVVVEVGGGVRAYHHGQRPVLDPYAVDAMVDGAHGTVLVPWPNRLGGGRYRFDGEQHQLPLSEPDHGNALHGLLRWRNFSVLEHEPARVVVGTRLHPAAGYPFALDVAVEYRLDEAGLEVATAATNVGERACPYGAGQHPYLSAGGGVLDDCQLELPAQLVVEVDERQLPCGLAPVEGRAVDFRRRRRIGQLQLDSAFTGLERDGAGRCTVVLEAPDGSRGELWLGEGYRYVELFTGDTLRPERRRRGLGVEPMTCPPNAFASGTDVIRLEPGETVTTRWGARLAGRAAAPAGAERSS